MKLLSIKENDLTKIKNSSRLIPDTHSTDEDIKRADLQTFIWRQCIKNIIEYPDPTDRG